MVLKKVLLKNAWEGRLRVNALSSPSQHMSTLLEEVSFTPASSDELSHVYRAAVRKLKALLRPTLLFHVGALLLLSIETSLFFFSAKKMVATAFLLGGIFATLFTYLVLLFYLQTRRRAELAQLKEEFLHSCREQLSCDAHLVIAEALSRFSLYLDDFSSRLYEFPLLHPLLHFLHRDDLFCLNEQLLHAAVEEHLAQVRLTPLDLEVHASCSRSYILLSKLYRRAARAYSDEAENAEKLALQELHILQAYAPDDPWVYEQLERGYARLGMHKEQLVALESLARLRPQESQILFRLGGLYFYSGSNAKGLQIYEQLKLLHLKKAEELIQRYGQNAIN
ncbi:MAG: hypothetical protein KGI80_03890 [Verrucomicrobiota bacterium]|nr:hypothetical protein [Verrucomicrobiota bacterium]